MEELKAELEEMNVAKYVGAVPSSAEEQEKVEWATKVETRSTEDVNEDRNGVHSPAETNGYHGTGDDVSEKVGSENGSEGFPVPRAQMLFSTCTAVPSALPPSSPILTKHTAGTVSPGSYHHTSYQAGINQRFHAARHKFQGTTEPDSQPQAAQTPSSLKEESSPVKHMARSTVTQVLSRFTTVQQSAPPKPATTNNSPFGTDYRSLAAPLSPIISRAAGALSQGVRSPTIPRADRGHPPPIPPKKPGLAQAPASPAAVPRSANHFTDSSLSGSCGLTSSQEGVKELDMVVSSN